MHASCIVRSEERQETQWEVIVVFTTFVERFPSLALFFLVYILFVEVICRANDYHHYTTVLTELSRI